MCAQSNFAKRNRVVEQTVPRLVVVNVPDVNIVISSLTETNRIHFSTNIILKLYSSPSYLTMVVASVA
jgi:hypothetical protein